ncbi:hypothetical protein AURDEDRAFT_167101 [Auricularia subglabra TFB-10046 SS5]|nr:hypothetical protein AURDEDRAFT_167101 [Auricularia subglabra TFB-10046 SS5]
MTTPVHDGATPSPEFSSHYRADVAPHNIRRARSTPNFVGVASGSAAAAAVAAAPAFCFYQQRLNVPALPYELVERIVDYLHDDQPSLRACSLVAAAWRAASLSHMFATMRLLSVSRFRKFVHVTCFRPRIALYVRSMHLSFAKMPDAFADLIPSIPHVAKNLETLGLEHTGHSPVVTRLLEHPMFAAITALSLTHVWFGSFVHLRELICTFARLRDLSINNVTWDLGPDQLPDDPGEPSGPAPALRLRHLYLQFNGNFLPLLVRWMISCQMLSELESLGLYLESSSVTLYYNELLAAVGHHLRQLNLHMVPIFRNSPRADEVMRDFTLCSCTRLERLHMQPSESGRPTSSLWMVSALRTLPLTATRDHLRDIRLTFSLWDAAAWSLIIELGRLETELVPRARYAALRTLAFHVRAEPRFRVRDFVRAHFPRLSRRAAVTVQQVW